MHNLGYTVLIIDDNSDDITLLERFLRRNLIPIRSILIAQSAQEGLEKIQSQCPDFVILGHMFQDMSSIDLLERLAEIIPIETLPILFLVNDEVTPAELQSLRERQVGVMKKSMLTPEKLRDTMLLLKEQTQLRMERNRAKTLFHWLLENSNYAVALTDAAGVLIAANKAYLNLFHPTGIGKQVQSKDYDDIFLKSDHGAVSKVGYVNENGEQVELEVKRLFIEERGSRSFMLSIFKTPQSEVVKHNYNIAPSVFSEADGAKVFQQLETIQKSVFQTAFVILRAKARRQRSNENLFSLLQEHNRRVKLMFGACECISSVSPLKVSTARYVEHIFEIFQKLPLMHNDVVMKYEGEDLELELDDAMLVGLILNELITNALQHAFTNRGGTLQVSFYKEKDENICMAVSDSGVGMPARIHAKPHDAMGLTIVKSLTKKLNGKIEVKRYLGTTIRILFSPKQPVRENVLEASIAQYKLS